jgi:large subunit ribosomal protein L4e
MARPLIGVYSGVDKIEQHVTLPAIFTAPIRPDVVQDVHTRMAKNKRQPYAVSKYAGHQSSAESWGTGRAVARIPRVSGGGTHRAGQGAFGNMCRKGRMFAPTKTWRRWHRKISVSQRRYALASALAASALPSLVLARGHRIEQIPEVPLVIDNKAVDGIDKSKRAVALLKSLNAYADVEKVKDSHHLRSGKGKMRNRRYVQRRGPLVIYNEKGTVTTAFRNLPGVELVSVTRLNLLQLAPGGHLGRFCIWTRDAFERLDSLYGTYRKAASEKKDYRLPRPIMTNPDLGRIINSSEVQNALRSKISQRKHPIRKKNPLRNLGFLVKLNPHALALRRRILLAKDRKDKQKGASVDAKQKGAAAKKTAGAKTASQKRKKVRQATKKFRQILLS